MYRITSTPFLLKNNKNKLNNIITKKSTKKSFQELKKLYTSYNTAYLNYINDKFKDITLEDTSQEK